MDLFFLMIDLLDELLELRYGIWMIDVDCWFFHWWVQGGPSSYLCWFINPMNTRVFICSIVWEQHCLRSNPIIWWTWYVNNVFVNPIIIRFPVYDLFVQIVWEQHLSFRKNVIGDVLQPPKNGHVCHRWLIVFLKGPQIHCFISTSFQML